MRPDAATDQGIVEDDCPLCLEPLPPIWDLVRRVVVPCCGKDVCGDCCAKKNAFLHNARASGSYGKEEEQLASTCPLCRTPIPHGDDYGRMMMEKFEKGQLPLKLYRELALTYLHGRDGVERNLESGVEILMLGAERGDSNCQSLLGYRYERGNGLPKLTAEAKKWYLAAIEQGHAMAEYNLACMEADEGNDAEYLRCMRSSASKGFGTACYELGLSHFLGKHGVQKSTEEAIRVLTPAAERGDTDCMIMLGDIMCSHDDQWQIDSPDFTRGVHWLRRAAEKGNEDAISNLKAMEDGASSMCFGCDKEATSEKAFLRCSRCRAAWYCSKDCQVQHWKAEEGGHKQFCIKWK